MGVKVLVGVRASTKGVLVKKKDSTEVSKKNAGEERVGERLGVISVVTALKGDEISVRNGTIVVDGEIVAVITSLTREVVENSAGLDTSEVVGASWLVIVKAPGISELKIVIGTETELSCGKAKVSETAAVTIGTVVKNGPGLTVISGSNRLLVSVEVGAMVAGEENNSGSVGVGEIVTSGIKLEELVSGSGVVLGKESVRVSSTSGEDKGTVRN